MRPVIDGSMRRPQLLNICQGHRSFVREIAFDSNYYYYF